MRSCTPLPWSYLEDRRVALLDVLGGLLDAFGVFFHQLDVFERPHALLLDGLAVSRILAGVVNDELLALARVHPVLEQAGGVGIGCSLEHRARTAGEGRTLFR